MEQAIPTAIPEFGEMRTYLLSKLMQDPYCDYEAEMNGYLEAVYGAGWQNIREFIDIMTEHAVTDSQHLYNYTQAVISHFNLPCEVAPQAHCQPSAAGAGAACCCC